jgi:hypothetical protein
MLDELTEELLDLTVTEHGHAGVGDAIVAFPICCSIALSLCCSSSSKNAKA